MPRAKWSMALVLTNDTTYHTTKPSTNCPTTTLSDTKFKSKPQNNMCVLVSVGTMCLALSLSHLCCQLMLNFSPSPLPLHISLLYLYAHCGYLSPCFFFCKGLIIINESLYAYIHIHTCAQPLNPGIKSR